MGSQYGSVIALSTWGPLPIAHCPWQTGITDNWEGWSACGKLVLFLAAGRGKQERSTIEDRAGNLRSPRDLLEILLGTNRSKTPEVRWAARDVLAAPTWRAVAQSGRGKPALHTGTKAAFQSGRVLFY